MAPITLDTTTLTFCSRFSRFLVHGNALGHTGENLRTQAYMRLNTNSETRSALFQIYDLHNKAFLCSQICMYLMHLCVLVSAIIWQFLSMGCAKGVRSRRLAVTIALSVVLCMSTGCLLLALPHSRKAETKMYL